MADNKLKVSSFFAGIGGFDLGLEKAGMKIVFQCEVNTFCQKILKKHWPNTPLHKNILELNASQIPKSDVWCGGFPCQDLSLANQGKRRGLGGERSGLFYKYAKLISQKKPRWVIIENVPGLLNSNHGRDFQTLLSKLDELGYCVSWKILDAKYFGTPQRRRRVYIVASYKNLGSTKVLFEKEGASIVSRQGLGKKDLAATKFSPGIGKEPYYLIQHATIGRKPSAGPQAKGFRNDGEAYTLDSRGSADVICSTTSPFGMREASRVPGGVDSNRYRAIGNAVCVHIIEWIGKRIIEVDRELSTVAIPSRRRVPQTVP